MRQRRRAPVRAQPPTHIAPAPIAPTGARVSTPLRAGVLILGLLLLAGCRREPVVTGFFGVPWGENLSQVIRRRGRPSSQGDAGPLGATVSYPARHLLDESAEPYFIVHPRWGMIQGNYLVPVVDFEARCEVVFNRFANTTAARYPELQPVPRRQARGSGPFCQQVLAGSAWASVRWTDPANGAEISVTLTNGRPFVDVAYTSKRARELEDAASARELKQSF